MRLRPIPIALAIVCLASTRVAVADDAGDATTDGDGGVDASGGTSSAANDDGPSIDTASPSDASHGAEFVVACDGALCDTTNGSECGVARGTAGNARFDSIWLAAMVAAVGLGIERRARRGARRPPLWSEPR